MAKNLRFGLLFLLISLAGATACRTSREEQAARSVDVFFESVANNDFEKVRELSTDDSQPVLASVEKEAKEYRPEVKPAKVEVEIVDKQITGDHALVNVIVKVGPKTRKEKVKLVLINDQWRIVVQKPQVQLVRYVVFYDQYELIVLPKIRIKQPVIIVKDDHHHHGHGHAYGHHKHKHKHHND